MKSKLSDPDGDFVSPNSHDFKPGRDSMYEAADKAKQAIDDDQATYSKSRDVGGPSPADPSLSNNSRGLPTTPGRSSNMGENVRS